MIIDTHAHLTDEKLAADIENFIHLADEADVRCVLTVGTTLETSRAAIGLSERFQGIRAAVGIHPNNCCEAAEGDWSEIVELSKHARVAALGETGLDRYWDDCPWELQVDYFRRHLQLSRETGLPVVIHTRECAEETLEILQEESRNGQVLGVMHSFTGPVAVAKGCLDLGLYVSFAGMVTFKNGEEIRQVAKEIPLDRILVETDSPYLTPHPHRGKRPNHPAMVAVTLEHLANVLDLSKGDLAEKTTANAERLFGAW